MFFPGTIVANKTIRKIEINGLTTQIMTGHYGFSEYLNRFWCKENPSSVFEPGMVGNIPHILLHCPVFALERYNLKLELDTKLTVYNISTTILST